MAPPHQRSAPRRGRLSRSADFQRVYRDGSSRSNRYLVVYWFKSVDGGTHGVDLRQDSIASGEVGPGPRVGFSVGRRVGNAVTRNRVKRVLREAFDLAAVGNSVNDYVLIARRDILELCGEGGPAAVAEELKELMSGLGPSSATGQQ